MCSLFFIQLGSKFDSISYLSYLKNGHVNLVIKHTQEINKQCYNSIDSPYTEGYQSKLLI